MNSFTPRDYIKGKPNASLKDCLSDYEKNKLINLADKQHLLLNMGEPIKEEKLVKKEVVESLVTQICENFKEDLFYIPPRELEFLAKVISMDFNVTNHIDYEDCSFLYSLGYIYLYDFNENIYPVIPKELRKLYEGIPKKKLEDKTRQSQELYSYATALVRLYGIYPVEQFVEVWNAHHKKSISLEEAGMYFYMMYDRQVYFKYDYQYVLSSHFVNNEGYRLLESMKDKPYYMPTKDEVFSYSKEPFDFISPCNERVERPI